MGNWPWLHQKFCIDIISDDIPQCFKVSHQSIFLRVKADVSPNVYTILVSFFLGSMLFYDTLTFICQHTAQNFHSFFNHFHWHLSYTKNMQCHIDHCYLMFQTVIILRSSFSIDKALITEWCFVPFAINKISYELFLFVKSLC